MSKSQEAIEAWLVEQLAHRTGLDSRRIDVHRPLAGYGLDSIVAVELTADLEEWLGYSVSETLMWDAPTIRAVAQIVSGEEKSDDPDKLPEQRQGAERPKAASMFLASPTTQVYPLRNLEQPGREEARPFAAGEAIAVIGLACRMPGARNAEAFWQLLLAGTDATGDVPGGRWAGDHSPEAAAGPGGAVRGGFLEQIDLFDAQFFGISPREATHMDPQQRLLLEVAWEALEHAGQAPGELAGSQTGIFLGISTHDYDNAYAADHSLIDAYTNTGNAHSIAASRLAYVLDLHGPALAIDTACSSSLVAIHLACQSLRCGETSLALAGGVNVLLSPEPTLGFSKARMISLQGRCKPFDAEADGLIRGEGCGMVILKRAADARADGDRILALIRGSAVNQDGHSSGLTAPNGLAQQRVIQQALKAASVAPAQLGYVIAQGTGTPVGDTVEFQALKNVLGERSQEEHVCALGSIKANIGHLEAASGVASLIAAIMALQHEAIPPQIHFHQPHPQLALEQAPISIPVEPVAWPRSEQARFAGVSAFSFSGTNAHLILEEAPLVSTRSECVPYPLYLLPLSARNEHALLDLLAAYHEQILDNCSPEVLTNICYTASTGRAHFDHRAAVLAETPGQFLAALQELSKQLRDGGESLKERVQRRPARLAFLCSCEGAEYAHMGRQLYETQAVFREALNRCAALLEGTLDRSLISVLYPAPDTQSPLHQPSYRHVATFALEYALALLWQSWGITPDIVAGYGVGVYVAACLAGAISLEDALILVTEQAQLWPSSQPIDLSASEAQSSPSHPFKKDASTLDAFERVASLLAYEPLARAYFCTTTGHYVPVGERLDAGYWRRHMLGSLPFAESIEHLSRLGYTTFVEIGPSASLSQQGTALVSGKQRTWLSSLSKDQETDWHSLLEALKVLYIEGFDIRWAAVYQHMAGRIISLPTYPFQRERYWITSRTGAPSSQKAAVSSHPLLGRRIPQHQTM